MAQLVLPFDEALDIAAGLRPLPREIESVACEDDTIHVTVRADGAMPRLLRAAIPHLRLALRYERFEDGVASFDIGTSLFSLPANKVVGLILGLVPLPDMDGVRIENTGGGPKLHLDLNGLLRQQAAGIEITELYLQDNDFIVVASIQGFGLRPQEGGPPGLAAPANPPGETP